MFTESDAWETEENQFNYLLDRAFVFLPTKEIVANFQYCMDPRPSGEFSANYNAYWLLRNLRGRLVRTTLTGTSPEALSHCHVLSSNTDGGRVVTIVPDYDTGSFNRTTRTSTATLKIQVALPPGWYGLERSDVSWNSRKGTEVSRAAQKSATVSATLAPCQAVAWTWTRQ